METPLYDYVVSPHGVIHKPAEGYKLIVQAVKDPSTNVQPYDLMQVGRPTRNGVKT